MHLQAGHSTTFCAIVGTSTNPEDRRKLFADSGVEMILESINDIPKGIKFRIDKITVFSGDKMKKRSNKIKRETKETDVSVTVNIDGTGKTSVSTGANFVDHLITAFGKHAMLDLTVKAKSKDNIVHHLIEDTAITIGNAIDEALGNRNGVTRFSYASVPMDESLAEASIDLVKRPFYKLVFAYKENKD